jgi:DNA-binding protein HU-beta
MTKAELITAVTKTVGRGLSKRAVEDIINALFQQLRVGLKKHKRFAFPDFGIFLVRKRAARTGRNPRTNQEIRIPAKQTVVFRPSKTFKASL